MKKLILFITLVSFTSFGQSNLLPAKTLEKLEGSSSGNYCNFPNYNQQFDIGYYSIGLERYINLSGEFYYFTQLPDYFNSRDFQLIEQNKDSLTNKSELKKDGNIFNFEFYNSNNVNLYEFPENLKSFTAQLNKVYFEVEIKGGQISYFKVISTGGRKKSHYKYTYNRDKSEWVLDYFDTGNKYTLSLTENLYLRYDKDQLVESSECDDDNKSITKHYDKNGNISDIYEAYVETLTDEYEINKTILTKYYPSGNISALTTSDEIWASIDPLLKQQTITYDVDDNQLKDKFLERKSIFEAYSEDGVFSIKNESALIDFKDINNGDIINVFKKHKNGKKEIFSTIKWKWNSKKWEKSFKRLIKTLNNF